MIPRWVGGKINWPGQLTPTPETKHTEQSDKELLNWTESGGSDFRLYDGSDLKTYLLMRW